MHKRPLIICGHQYLSSLGVTLLVGEPRSGTGLDGVDRVRLLFVATWPEGCYFGRASRPTSSATYSLDPADGREQWLDETEAREIFSVEGDFDAFMEGLTEVCDRTIQEHPATPDI